MNLGAGFAHVTGPLLDQNLHFVASYDRVPSGLALECRMAQVLTHLDIQDPIQQPNVLSKTTTACSKCDRDFATEFLF